MSASADRPIPRSVSAQFAPASFLSLPVCLSSGFTHNASHGSPSYNLKTETKAKGFVDGGKLIDLASRKALVDLIVKGREDKVVAYMCPGLFRMSWDERLGDHRDTDEACRHDRVTA